MCNTAIISDTVSRERKETATKDGTLTRACLSTSEIVNCLMFASFGSDLEFPSRKMSFSAKNLVRLPQLFPSKKRGGRGQKNASKRETLS